MRASLNSRTHPSKSAVAWGPSRSLGRVCSWRQSTAYVSIGFTGGSRPVPQMNVAPRSTWDHQMAKVLHLNRADGSCPLPQMNVGPRSTENHRFRSSMLRCQKGSQNDLMEISSQDPCAASSTHRLRLNDRHSMLLWTTTHSAGFMHTVSHLIP